jgi:hypothetical protein
MRAITILVALVAFGAGCIVGAAFFTPWELSAYRTKANIAEEQRELHRRKAEVLQTELDEINAVLEGK